LRFTLRPYQQVGVHGIREAYRAGKRSPLFVLPTGGGKTVVFCHIAEQAAARGTLVIVLVHREELLFQASLKLQEYAVPHGLIAPGAQPLNRDLHIASVQTLVRRLPEWQKRAEGRKVLLVVDEAHHAVAGSWQKILDAFPSAHVLGVTATPARLDGKGLGNLFDSLIVGPTIPELTALGALAPMEVLGPPSQIDLSGVRKVAGDYNRADLDAAINKAAIVGDAVKHYEKYVQGRPSIAFCVSVAHAEAVAEQFRLAGYQAAAVDGKLDKEERRRRIKALGNGNLHVLTSCEIISEGVDVPVCQSALLLRPTQSLTLFLQQVGRALRPKPDGSAAIVLDHSGNCRLHGHPGAAREWNLVEGYVKPKKKSALIKTCKECFALFAPGPRACPRCGYELPKADRPLPPHVEGELQRFGLDSEFIVSAPIRDVVKSVKTLEQLRVVAEARGLEDGWAEHVLAGKKRAREHVAMKIGGGDVERGLKIMESPRGEGAAQARAGGS
jgi:DNA repair protein RadD